MPYYTCIIMLYFSPTCNVALFHGAQHIKFIKNNLCTLQNKAVKIKSEVEDIGIKQQHFI